MPILKWIRNQVYSCRFRGQLSTFASYLPNLFTPVAKVFTAGVGYFIKPVWQRGSHTTHRRYIFWQIMTPTRAKNGTKTRVCKLLNLPKLTLVEWIINIRYCYWHTIGTIAIIQTTMRYADNSVTVCIKIETFFFYNRRTVIRKNSVCVRTFIRIYQYQ